MNGPFKPFALYLGLIFLLFSSFVLPSQTYQYNLAICSLFKDEAAYLREWIEFHKLVGVEHFYLFNNLSSDDYYTELAPYLESGEVELIQWEYAVNDKGTNWGKIQNSAYNHGLSLACGKVKWLAILDTDEFVFPVEVYTLSEFLKDYEGFGGVSINWQMYGTSQVSKIYPGHLMIEDLIYKAPTDFNENVHVKTIVRPELVEANTNPHFCVYLPGYTQVNSAKEPFKGPFSPVLVDKIRINHYWTRDEDFLYNVKIPRRTIRQDNSCLIRAEKINKEIDTSIFKYVPDLKEALFKGATSMY